MCLSSQRRASSLIAKQVVVKVRNVYAFWRKTHPRFLCIHIAEKRWSVLWSRCQSFCTKWLQPEQCAWISGRRSMMAAGPRSDLPLGGVGLSRPVAGFSGLGKQNTFLGGKHCCFYYVWNNFFRAQQNLGKHCPRCPRVYGPSADKELRIR